MQDRVESIRVFFIANVPYLNMESYSRNLMQGRIPYSDRTNLVDLKKIKRILEILAENGRVKRTQLSAKTGMNYDRCMRYINILKLIKMVEVVVENNCNYIIITQTGMEIINALDYI